MHAAAPVADRRSTARGTGTGARPTARCRMWIARGIAVAQEARSLCMGWNVHFMKARLCRLLDRLCPGRHRTLAGLVPMRTRMSAVQDDRFSLCMGCDVHFLQARLGRLLDRLCSRRHRTLAGIAPMRTGMSAVQNDRFSLCMGCDVHFLRLRPCRLLDLGHPGPHRALVGTVPMRTGMSAVQAALMGTEASRSKIAQACNCRNPYLHYLYLLVKIIRSS